MTHLDFRINVTHHFVGWNPGETQWERILVAEDSMDTLTVTSPTSFFNDETGELDIWFKEISTLRI